MLSSALAWAQSYSPPAGNRPASRRLDASVVPGGRLVSPEGQQYPTGPGPFGLALSASGKTLVTANLGPDIASLTVLERGKTWEVRQLQAEPNRQGRPPDENVWRSVSLGVAFSGERTAFVAEGNSGRVALIDLPSGERRRAIDLNQSGYRDSFTGELALDEQRGVLYVADQANFRVAAIDTRSRQILASLRVGRLPFAMTLSTDRRKLYVANAGMFQYQALPGALAFPPFGFPSAAASVGVELETERGAVRVPGLGDPNAPESNSVSVIDVSDPAAPKLETFVRTGQPFSPESLSGSSPSGIVAAADRVYVSNAGNDSITVIDALTNRNLAEIQIRIPNLEQLRGITPMGLAYDQLTGWLLVAEAGINAVGVIDTRSGKVLGHIPAGWFPTRVAVDRGTVFVTNLRGEGSAPNAVVNSGRAGILPQQPLPGSISIYPLPAAAAMSGFTDFVMRACGFEPRPVTPRALPAGIRHVVLIVKSSRAFDEVLGDVTATDGGPVMGAPLLARFGRQGYVDGRGERLSLHLVDLTPNHHAIAERWAFSDNFYADSGSGVSGRHWLQGSYPIAWTESSMRAAWSGGKDFRLSPAPGRLEFIGVGSSLQPEDAAEGGNIWSHLSRHGISFYNFGEGLDAAFLTNMPMPEPLYRNTSRIYPGSTGDFSDTERAHRLIDEINDRFVRKGTELPQFLYIHLRDAHPAKARPPAYPYPESFLADSDDALGRILEYLSGTKWWPEMTVFVTQDSAQGGVDHIDVHRTPLLCAGPWIKRSYVSHANASFPGLLKTIFEIFRLPPLNLYDASAADLSDCFQEMPDGARYQAAPVDKRIYAPVSAGANR
jgi:YVTN family beta-propeller protein